MLVNAGNLSLLCSSSSDTYLISPSSELLLICRIGNVSFNVKIPQNETVIYGFRTYDNCNSPYDIMHYI